MWSVRTTLAALGRSKDADYLTARQEFSRQRLSALFAYVAAIYPAFGVLDVFVYPAHVRTFLTFRAVGLGLGLPLFALSRRMRDRTALAAGVTLVVYETGSIAVMCAMTGGFSSPYLVGIILCFLGATTIEAFEPLPLTIVLLGLTLFYVAVNLCVPFRGADASASVCFITGAVVFCVICGVLLEEQRRALFAANAELRKRNADLELAKQQQGKFLSTISHELRSPVHAMLGFAELVEGREHNLLPKSRDNLQRVQQSGAHLLHLINDLLDLAKAEAGRMEIETRRFDLIPVLQEVAEQTRALVRTRDVTVNIVSPDECECTSDPLRLKQILVNLMSNAAKFTPRGTIELSVSKSDTNLVIAVRDTGVGIPPDSRQLIFEAFRQVHQGLGVGGTGLGLSIVSHLVDLLGGSIEVESEVGAGSTFRITFHATAQQVAA